MKNKMKQLFGIILSLVLVLGLMPGMSMMVYAASVPVSPEGSGTVTVEIIPSDDTGSITTYVFTASPSEGYAFDRWTGVNGGTTDSNPLSVPEQVVNNWTDFSAVFVKATNPTIVTSTVTLNANGGTINSGSYVDADIDVDDETHIVTLSTCSYDSNVRFTVSAVRVDEHEW